MNCFWGVPAIAVGLSAISFSASLQKDAAPIPNALEAPELRLLTKKVETHQRHIVYLLCRMIRLYKFPDGNKLNKPNNCMRFAFILLLDAHLDRGHGNSCT